jgi:hypothetical protein
MDKIPKVGEVGSVNLTMFRGIKDDGDRLHKDFASDPGDYGCGEYWTDSYNGAQIYGTVISKTIILENVYHIPSRELMSLIKEYGTCKMEDGHELRKLNSMRLTSHFKSKGFSGVLTSDYESPSETAICIFGD